MTAQQGPAKMRTLITSQARTLVFEGKPKEAEQSLNNLLKQSLSTAERLEVLALLIRLAAESRNVERFPELIAEVKKLEVTTDADKEALADCIYSTATGWFYLGNHDKARSGFEQAREIFSNLANETKVLKAEFSLAEIMRQEGRYFEILENLSIMKERAERLADNFLLGDVLILEGNIYRKTGDYVRAIDAYEKAREFLSENKNSEKYHYTLWALGTCYAALEDKTKAKIYLELASNNFKGAAFVRINILSLLTLAELYTVLGQYSDAEQSYKRVEELVGSEENSYFGRRLLRGQALLAIKRGEFDVSNRLIDQLVLNAIKEKNSKEIMRLRLLKAEVLLRGGESLQHEEARAMLQEALAFYREQNVRRHQAVCLELLARLDSASGYPQDSLKKVEEMLGLAQEGGFERLVIRAHLAKLVLMRKLGNQIKTEELDRLMPMIEKLSASAERVALLRFKLEKYEEWTSELNRLDPHSQRFVNEFFEDFHFIPNQTVDLEIDRNSHYVREKHLGEIPFHNKFTLMKILLLLAETPGREFSKEQLAKEIWEQEYNPLRHDNNIYININRLRKLIEPNPRESRYVMNGSRGYYLNPAMKVNISSKIADVAPRAMPKSKTEGPRA